jgi:serine/threonine-protein kinase HipA
MNHNDRLNVWTSDSKSGLLAREERRKIVFRYDPTAKDAVSLTMPVRLESWVSPELHPIFQMNLPEGDLLEAIRRALAKLIGDDDFTILQATGGNQIGRNRFAFADQASPSASQQTESLEELLTYPDTRELFHALIERYALRSGVSGVQPKVLLEASERASLPSGGYIVKTWGVEYPQLAANEFFCMTAAQKAGLKVPEFHLAENGGLFIMKRFDRTDDGGFLGFEDMCSLQAFGTAQKYRGSYERVAKSLSYFISGTQLPKARRQLFATLVLSCMVGNGDAHLKNFGVLYADPKGEVALAPVYDIVTTSAYIREDVPALSIAGTKKWWPRKTLEQFATTHLMLTRKEIAEIFDQLSQAVSETRPLLQAHIHDHPEFQAIGERMLDIWNEGVIRLS